MQRKFQLSSVIPSGLAIEGVTLDAGLILITARAISATGACPLCESPSRRVHSRYMRRLSDLPCAGRGIRLHLAARRFRCDEPLCRQRIFAERFDHGVVTSRSRRTARLDCIVHHLGLALGGRPGARFAKRLMLPVSNDTLLRLVRRRSQRPVETLRVVGIDDWAFRRNHRYGSIVCDLERRRIVTLLPDRERATIEAWLKGHPGIEVVSRDRGGGYGEAAAKALPRAVQVADRWHLMENASAAFLEAVRKSMVDSTWEDEVIKCAASTLQPSQDAAPGRVEQLELNGSAGFLLDDDGARPNRTADHEVADLHLDDVATAQLAVDCKIEHGSVSEPPVLIEAEPNGPDLLRL